MRFLVSNDDGIAAPGVKILAETLSNYGEVTVVCPDGERSAFGHSITTRRPLRARKVEQFAEGITAYAVDGTPADCVKFGLDVLMTEQPDVVITGVNAGANVGQDYFYSGTMGAAREAVFYGIPAIATSAARDSDDKIDFSQVQQLLDYVLKKIIHQDLPSHMLLNVNLPSRSISTAKGIKVVPMELTETRFKFVPYKDPKGRPVYWLKNQYHDMVSDEKADYHLVREGYITISPIELMQNSSELNSTLMQWFD